jgi:opacity protein-like surface antigen
MRLFLAAALIAVVTAAPARSSQLVDRNASNVKLAVNAKGEALLTYEADGTAKHVLAWGAVNAIAPTGARGQVEFSLDYSGGHGKYHRDYWKTFGGDCGDYDGPPLAWVVVACKAPDGSYWALQAWQRSLPDYGVPATAAQSVRELHLSHWTGPIAVLTIKEDWSYRRFDHLYGSLTYGGGGVYGFRSTRTGSPLDTFGRNVYVDTFGSAYGAGWKRENSFLTHRPNGSFCYGFYPHGGHPTGKGAKYRATVIGPGVTPDVMWQGTSPGAYDRAADLAANADQRTALKDPACKVN